MTRYIDADSVRDEILYGEAYVSAELEVYIKKVFDEATAADVAPVVHGKWVYAKTFQGMKTVCSICGEIPECFEPYCCPNCGAKMDLEE